MLKAQPRYCLWIEDDKAEAANSIEAVAERLKAVATFRAASKASSTQRFSDRPHSFVQISHQESPCLAVPGVSSKRRAYIPMDYLTSGTVISNKVYGVYNAEVWLLALLHSSMHMCWVRTVCGRLKSDYSYGNTLGYNTFPFPDLDHAAQLKLDDSALAVLAARERWPDRSLADLYDPDKTVSYTHLTLPTKA